MQKMVDDLLMVGMLDQAKLLLKREPIQVTELLGRVMKWHEKEAKARNVSLSLSLPEDLAIEGDVSVLQRVVHNMVESSIRHTPSSGRVELSARSGSGIGDRGLQHRAPTSSRRKRPAWPESIRLQ